VRIPSLSVYLFSESSATQVLVIHKRFLYTDVSTDRNYFSRIENHEEIASYAIFAGTTVAQVESNCGWHFVGHCFFLAALTALFFYSLNVVTHTIQ
jgi:hypothetical protein